MAQPNVKNYVFVVSLRKWGIYKRAQKLLIIWATYVLKCVANNFQKSQSGHTRY